MRVFRMIVAAALALPALAVAQVGPNPAVSGGSQDPTVGASMDSVTAPENAKVGAPATGNIIDRTTGSADATVSDGGADANATASGAGTTTTSETQATTKPMRHRKAPR